MQFLTILKLVVSILPLLIDAIKAAENAIPGQGKGKEKLSAVRSVIESSYQLSSSALPAFESAWPIMEKTISGLVASFNAAGIFK